MPETLAGILSSSVSFILGWRRITREPSLRIRHVLGILALGAAVPAQTIKIGFPSTRSGPGAHGHFFLLLVDEAFMSVVSNIEEALLETPARLIREKSPAVVLVEKHAKLALELAQDAVGTALLALIATGLVPAVAAEPEPPRGVLSLQIDNDLFAGTDRNYTSGTRIAYVTPLGPSHPLEASVRALPFFEGQLRVTYALGQKLFTPINISESRLVTTDEPYAGYLYAGFEIESELRREHGHRILVRTELQVGIVGPSALGKQAQLAAHAFTGSEEAKGWDNQLKDEPTLNVYYDRVWSGWYETRIGEAGSGYSVDLSPHAGAALGNVYTHAAGGFTVRFGRNLPTGLGPRFIGPSPPGSDYYQPTRDARWHLFLGLEGRAVARNIFLDGNTFTDSHSVDKNVLVGELRAGVSAMLGRYRLGYAQVYRTRQFRGQVRETFGSLSLATAF